MSGRGVGWTLSNLARTLAPSLSGSDARGIARWLCSAGQGGAEGIDDVGGLAEGRRAQLDDGLGEDVANRLFVGDDTFVLQPGLNGLGGLA